MLVEFTTFEEDTKVLQNRLDRTRHRREPLEHFDGLGGTKDPARGSSGNLGSLAVLLVLHVHLELILDDVVRTGQTTASREADGQFGIVEGF